jgi:hypothetical protein
MPNIGPSRVTGNLATNIFGFDQTLRQNFFQGRVDYNRSDRDQFFARYTFDDADQLLPTDFPQFPRTFFSRNQFFTGEYRQTLSAATLNTFRLSFSRTRVGQNVEANITNALPEFVPGRGITGDIDIGGIPRFGPQSSGNLRLVQNVFGGEYSLVHSRGRHLLKAGALAERYQDNMVNPTFSNGIYTFASVGDFLQNRAQRFIGLTPGAQFDRYWRFTLFGLYAQDTWRIHPRLSLSGGLRYEASTMPVDLGGRDVSLPNLSDRTATIGPLYENPTLKNFAPRVGFAWDATGDGRTSVRGGYGIYYNTNNQQNLIVTVTNPPATPRPVVNNPAFPVPNFAGSLSIRPVQFDLDNPYLQVWNLNVQRELWFDTLVDASIFREWIANVGRRNSRARMAHVLCEFALRLKVAGLGEQTGYELPMTQEQLADATGMTAVHVNRTLKRLEADGLIDRSTPRSIHIGDWRKLASVGDFNPAYLHLNKSDLT